MTKYLAGVLTVIAAGVLLIAYGLLAPGAAASYRRGDPMVDMSALPSGIVPRDSIASSAVPSPYAMPVSMMVPVQDAHVASPSTVALPRARRATVHRVAERPRRDWMRTALVIGGSSAAGAGVGGIVGGKKGALIGAAIGGGASTLYETTKH